MAGPGRQLFASPLFGGARAALLSIFGSIWGPIGSPFGHILVHFGGLDFESDFGAKSEAFWGGAGGRGGLPVPARTCKICKNLQELGAVSSRPAPRKRGAANISKGFAPAAGPHW